MTQALIGRWQCTRLSIIFDAHPSTSRFGSGAAANRVAHVIIIRCPEDDSKEVRGLISGSLAYVERCCTCECDDSSLNRCCLHLCSLLKVSQHIVFIAELCAQIRGAKRWQDLTCVQVCIDGSGAEESFTGDMDAAMHICINDPSIHDIPLALVRRILL